MAIYEHDPGAQPDADFEPGELGHLIAGARGRLLDARRTPVTVTSVSPREGMFELVIEAFEDRGAVWQIPLEDVSGYQFERGSARAQPEQVQRYERAVAHLSKALSIEVDRSSASAGALLDRGWRTPASIDRFVNERSGDPRLAELLLEHLVRPELQAIEQAFAQAYVSNPHSGEIVLGHAVVLAELGLRSYRGRAPRTSDVFAGGLTRELRAEHLIERLGFARALWERIGRGRAAFRAVSGEGGLDERPPGTFVSATLAREVALAHLDGERSGREGRLSEGPLPIERVLMSFMETAAMNLRYREAEIVLIGGLWDERPSP